MTPLDTHLLLTLPLVIFVVGGMWLWGLLERWRDEGQQAAWNDGEDAQATRERGY